VTAVVPWGDTLVQIAAEVEGAKAAAKAAAKAERKRKRGHADISEEEDDDADDERGSAPPPESSPKTIPRRRRGPPEEWVDRCRPFLTFEEFDTHSIEVLRALVPAMYARNTKGNTACTSSNKKWLRRKLVGTND
jgi:hypothetical protein